MLKQGAVSIFSSYTLAVASLLRKEPSQSRILWILPDDTVLETVAALVRFFCQERPILLFPAWDCLPYDRVSPKKEGIATRMRTLDLLLQEPPVSYCLLTTLSAISQRLPPPTFLHKAFSIRKGGFFPFSSLVSQLLELGFKRVETVFSPGEFSIRGDIVDIFPAGEKFPYRIDFLDNDVERIRTFDPETQRSQEETMGVRFSPVSEIALSPDICARFVERYRALSKTSTKDDPLLEAIATGRFYEGQEHWLPLFHDHLTSFFAYLPPATRGIIFPSWYEDLQKRDQQIKNFFAARQQFLQRESQPIEALRYCPILPELLYLSLKETVSALSSLSCVTMDAYVGAQCKPVDFTLERYNISALLQKAANQLTTAQKLGKKVLLTCATEGSRVRTMQAFSANTSLALSSADTWDAVRKENQQGNVPVVRLQLQNGCCLPDLLVLTDTDLWGERLGRSTTRRKKARPLEQISLTVGDYVVHEDHGIGQYQGIRTLAVEAIRHDCLEILYDKGDKLYVPVENLERVSRYGAEDVRAPLDRLGTLHWQQRKARVKERLGVMAQKLIDLAAQRLLKEAPASESFSSLKDYDLFCMRFPHLETEDQLRAIADVEADLRSGHFADRLICGDVGFGKTEVALRAAFAVVSSGKQVAIVVPTTLLCRQHFHTSSERFAGFPVRIAFLSRLTPLKDKEEIYAGLAHGNINIVIGTHTLLKETVRFQHLGLLVIDEEQHFGVKQKEYLKALSTEAHVLTLTATPIPRTLQLSLTGVRDLSVIASPPMDRRAVHTFVMPFDPVILREAILREQARQGYVFYVCPRIEDLVIVAQFLREFVPEVRFCVAHGQMPASVLETTISDFLDGKYDVLLATNIIESGIDILTANTLILHRSDRFGLSQLYQLRGRVGRSQVQAYAYFTYEAHQPLSGYAKRRLEILERLDHLGAGFTLASFDLDLRGAGNLLGEEQSGHIHEVGAELYQNMLKQAVETIQSKDNTPPRESFSPQLSLGLSVFIPETYVRDLGVRFDLYRRAAMLCTSDDKQEFVDELVERFGPLPLEVENLLTVIRLRNFAKKAFVRKLELTERGALLGLNSFPNPAGLLTFIEKSRGTILPRPGDKIFVKLPKEQSQKDKLKSCEKILLLLAKLTKQE
ncbi:MAG: transcription-repair coupling factor [Holosporales bacterium]|nr:transcription-repair coupling factor [Holosporales bacterium]